MNTGIRPLFYLLTYVLFAYSDLTYIADVKNGTAKLSRVFHPDL